MKWIQENPFLSGLAALVIVGLGVQIYFLLQAKSLYEETTAAYEASVGKLRTLQNRSPFPNVENLKKTEAEAEEFKTELRALRTQLAEMEAPLNPDITPQQFSDELREKVDQTKAKAAEAGVALPEQFFLGFDRYANSPPDARAASALQRQLSVIDQLVNRLIDFKVQSIDTLARRPLPEEEAPEKETKEPKILQRYVVDLAFTSEQSKFRAAFNALLDVDNFFIVRALSVQNSNAAGPPIQSQAAPEQTGMAAPGFGEQTAATEKPADHLEVILGREAVQVTLQLEILDFEKPEAPEAPETAKK